MLRLDPALPPAWRDATRLQFGLEPALVLTDPEPWHEILVHALGAGVTLPDAVALAAGHGVPAADVHAFLARLRPVLIDQGPRRRIHLDVAGTFPHPTAADAAQLLADTFELAPAPEHGTPVVLVAAHLVHPARAAAMAREDLTHLPLVFRGDRAVVGPLLVPGDGPCLECENAYRRAADPAWPTVAAQLLSRPAAPVARGFLAEALAVAALFLSGRVGTRARSHAVTISARALTRTWVGRAVHPGCGCRSPAGTGSADASTVRSSPPTTATAFAQPA